MNDPRDEAIREALAAIDRQNLVIDGLRHQRNELEAEVAWLRQRVAELDAINTLLPPAGAA